ncbi:uncharacterized protein LOC130978282 [Arachis stenosperma]|uniref:uncharacterized protein LOC130978282 n=1 Tax=Arachis stenosperma TaxID=217475 RepID=UPI0025AC4392|nr:uncharacterized protein LOC130978282 [Arachis stenosperma]
MPFGLKNAGATYQRLVNKIFRNLTGNKIEVYIDDMLAKTESGEQLTDDLKVIMNTLRKHQMRLNPTKCAFGMEAGKFLGFMITQRGVEANPEKCRAVLEMTSPKNLKDIQKLTGRLTALSRFLGASAQKAIPFFKLMKKGIPFKWEKECEEAFQHFKKVLTEPPILAKPQTGETLYLYLSITEETIAAALVRENEKKEQKPIYFISKVLQDTEARYSRLEKLAFALLSASRRLRQYFQAHPITVRTDQTVKQVLQKPDLAGRMLAWSIELSQFQIRFEPRNAIKAQALADFIAEMTPTKLTPEPWKLHVDGSSNSTHGGAGIILENQNGITIEQSIRYDFPVSNNQAEYEALLAGLNLAREVGAKLLEVNTDSQVLGNRPRRALPHGTGQLRYLIVAIDYYTKWIEAEPLASITATQCRKFVWRQIITRFGIPEVIISDNGTQFTDKKFRELLEGLHVSHRFSSVEHPQTNGQVESANKIIVKGLKKRLDEAKGLWADELGSVLWSYRTTPQTSTGETPFRLTYGVEAVIPVEIGDPSPRKTVGGNDEEAERDLIDEARSIAHVKELALKQRISLRYNHGVIRREFADNDLVLRRNDIGLPTPGEGKLAPNWEGPYRVKAVIGKGAYKLERLDGSEIPRTWNAANLRRYYT